MVLKRCSSERGEREKRFYGDGKGERRRTVGGLDQFNASLKGVVADLLKRAADTPRGGPSFSVRSSTSNL